MRVWIDRSVPWALRVAWALLPIAAGSGLAHRLDGWNTGARTAASLLLWAGWATVAVATCVATPISLAVARVGVAAGVGVTAAARTPAVIVAIVAAAIAARPEAAEWFVNGPAYANERRFPLRVPGPVAFGPLWLASALVVVGPAEGIILVAGGHYVLGVPVLVVGAALAYFSARSLYVLTRRWVVFVPAGLVLHDPLALVDPVLFERPVIETLRAAPADTDSLDLTQAALGLAVELVLLDKVPMVRNLGRKHAEAGSSARLLFTPTRPGRVLAEAAERRIPVG
ncbi:MAG TPA: hypothetical protein VHC63_10560 [Acidimicrobiales bacterium]|nr:hypothetical protein [Acidimicrobiales bacterium]